MDILSNDKIDNMDNSAGLTSGFELNSEDASQMSLNDAQRELAALYKDPKFNKLYQAALKNKKITEIFESATKDDHILGSLYEEDPRFAHLALVFFSLAMREDYDENDSEYKRYVDIYKIINTRKTEKYNEKTKESIKHLQLGGSLANYGGDREKNGYEQKYSLGKSKKNGKYKKNTKSKKTGKLKKSGKSKKTRRI